MKHNTFAHFAIALLIGFAVPSFCKAVVRKHEVNELRQVVSEQRKTIDHYKVINDNQKQIIIDYGKLSGIKVTTVSKHVEANKELHKLETKANDLLKGEK